MRRLLILIWLLLAMVAVPSVGDLVSGELTARYRDRWGTEDWEDQDIYTYLWLDFSEEDNDFGLGGGLSMRWNVDLQTRANEIDDGKDDVRVYTAFMDITKAENFDLRLGRMILDDAEGFHITGAKGLFKLPWKRMKLGLFVGQPVSYYSSVSGEWTAGGSFSLKTSLNSRLRGSFIHVEEDIAEDDVVTLSYRRSSRQGWSAWGTVRTINFDVWNEFLGFNFLIAPIDLHLTATYRRQENTNDSDSRYFSHFAATLGSSQPYQRITLSLNRPFADYFSIGAGWTERALLDSTDENRTNREYTRFFANVFVFERVLWGFEASADYSRWYTEGDSNDTISGSLSRKVGDRLRFDLGTYYAKYENRRTFDRPDEAPVERFDVRSYYLRGAWRVRHKYRIQVELERGEDDSSEDAFYQLELRFGLDLGFLASGFSR